MRWIKSAASAALFLCSLALVYAFFPIEKIVITTTQKQCVWPSKQFYLKWRHSVEKTQWQEHYLRDGEKLLLLDTSLVSFGAGTPNDYPIISQNNGVVQFRVNRRFPELNWTVSRNMQGQIWDKQVWDIAQDLPDFSIVHIQVERASRWKMWLKGGCV